MTVFVDSLIITFAFSHVNIHFLQNVDDIEAFTIGPENTRSTCYFGGTHCYIGATTATNLSNA